MSDISILREPPKLRHKEPAIDCNAEEFEKVIRSRRSVRAFTEEPIPEDILAKCIDAALLAPNSSNLQQWEFYRVKDPAKKKELARICMGQSAARTAQELIVCVARIDKWKEMQQKMIAHLDAGEEKAPKGVYDYYRKIVPIAYTQGPLGLIGLLKKIAFFFIGLSKVVPREPTSKADMRVWAHKSTALGCENLMLAFRAYGYDSCPMEGYDSTRVKKLLNLPRGAEICMIVGAGKRDEHGVYGKQIRMPKENFYFEV